MKLYTEDQLKLAIRFGFESRELLNEGDEFISSLKVVEFKAVGSHFDFRQGRDVIQYELKTE